MELSWRTACVALYAWLCDSSTDRAMQAFGQRGLELDKTAEGQHRRSLVWFGGVIASARCLLCSLAPEDEVRGPSRRRGAGPSRGIPLGSDGQCQNDFEPPTYIPPQLSMF